jgi:ribosomal subunit interface protein
MKISEELGMNRRIVFRHMDHSDVLEAHANQQLEKIENFLEHEPQPVFLDLIFEPSKVHKHHRVTCLLKSPHYDLVTHQEISGEEFYRAVDDIIDTMYRLLREAKERMVDERKQRGRHEEFKKER